ncbi:MAG TPA: oligopeptide:H+ symporter, partial [Myxococcales bacterium]|nr:oligopeptide:H+ symporter [Myxococcales bacterium]
MNDLSKSSGERSRTLGFVTLFLIEMWERFGYYGMTAVVVLYMVQRLTYTDDRANLTFGAFVALAYAIPALGGFIGDKLLGTKRTAVLGAVVLACGYTLLAIPDRPSLLFPALALVAVGGGVFKANPANLVSRLYEGDSAKLDSAYTMYYMAVNVGATLSQIATPLIAIAIGWHAAFAICAAGLVLGLLNYFFMRRFLAHVGSRPDFEPLDFRRLALVLVGIAVGTVCVAFIIQNRDVARALVVAAFFAMIFIFGWMMKRGTDRERKGLWAVIILTAEAMLFFIFYQQMSTSLTLFSLRNVELNVFGYHVP